ncbi:MAG: DUF4212 domain-containing protein [Opitutaceae bacterium]
MPLNPSKTATNGVAYWRAVIRLTLGLLAVWALVSIVAAILLVEPLNEFNVGRLPAGFWMAQQGSILVFVVLIFVYARRMDRLDENFKKDRQP